MKRYTFLIGLLSLLIISCGGGKNSKITLTWWNFWTDAAIKPVIEQMTADFEREHPDINVQLVDLTWADGHEKIAIAFSSGSGPDVVELGSDWIPEFSSTGHLWDMTARVDSVRDQYLMWAPALYDGRVYAFPWILGTRVLFGNIKLLEQAGYKRDFVPTTWNELYEASKAVSDKADSAYGFGSNAAERHRLYKKFLPFLWSNGGAILSEDGQHCELDSPQAIAALKYYLKLCDTGMTDTQRRLEDAFLEGKIGFVISGDWLLKRIGREKPDFEFATCLIPAPKPGDVSVSFAGGEYLAVNAKSAHQEAAYQFIRHICSPENQLLFCMKNRTANPSSKVTAADSTFLSQPHFETFVKQMETSRMPPVNPQWVYIEAKLEAAIEAALYKAKTPEQALMEAKAEIERLLAQ